MIKFWILFAFETIFKCDKSAGTNLKSELEISAKNTLWLICDVYEVPAYILGFRLAVKILFIQIYIHTHL